MHRDGRPGTALSTRGEGDCGVTPELPTANRKLRGRKHAPPGGGSLCIHQTPQKPSLNEMLDTQCTDFISIDLAFKFNMMYYLLCFLSAVRPLIHTPFSLVRGKVCSVPTTKCASSGSSLPLAGSQPFHR